MANPNILAADTILYSAAEPEGRTFCAGESWPGDAWSTKVGGEPVGAQAAAGALKDLIEANDRMDRLNAAMASKDHDLAVMASERDAATGKVADLEQRAIAAEKAQADAEEAARNYMVERDTARSEAAKAKADLAAAEELVAGSDARVSALVEQLNTANQTIADLNDPAKPAKGAPAAEAPPA